MDTDGKDRSHKDGGRVLEGVASALHCDSVFTCLYLCLSVSICGYFFFALTVRRAGWPHQELSPLGPG